MAETTMIYDIAVIGGGASGMMAAIGAASRLGGSDRVVVLEGGQRVGRKLLASGNGRCNYSNTRIDASSYNHPDFVARVFHACPPNDIIDRFAKSGLMAVEEEGRLYPASGASSSVLDILRILMEEKEVAVLTDNPVTNIHADSDFRLDCAGGLIEARKIILACGGKAAPQLGGDRNGFALAEGLGHDVTDLKPGLAGLKCPADRQRGLGLPALNGLRVSGTAYLYRDDKLLAKEKGEILFREFGLSGIAIFNLSRFTQGNWVVLDIMPRYTLPNLTAELHKRVERQSARPLKEFFTGVFQRIVGEQLMKAAEVVTEGRDCGSLTKAELEDLAKQIKGWAFPVDGPVGWQNAQITLGGLELSQFNATDLESQLVPGLYACGEILDVDGPCGGYNLQWAWSSGLLAGWSAARGCVRETSP